MQRRVRLPTVHPSQIEEVFALAAALTFKDMGHARDIVLYKHRMTRRYLNIDTEGCFYRYSDGNYVEVTEAVGLEHARN